MATASVTVRVDEDTKRAAANIVEDFGFDLSSVTRIPLTLEYPTPNLESREAIRETKELIASGDPGYATVSEMFEAMGA